ncbi:hypothetical protein H5410_003829, partial [Solanum commersonii]
QVASENTNNSSSRNSGGQQLQLVSFREAGSTGKNSRSSQRGQLGETTSNNSELRRLQSAKPLLLSAWTSDNNQRTSELRRKANLRLYMLNECPICLTWCLGRPIRNLFQSKPFIIAVQCLLDLKQGR